MPHLQYIIVHIYIFVILNVKNLSTKKILTCQRIRQEITSFVHMKKYQYISLSFHHSINIKVLNEVVIVSFVEGRSK